MPPKKEMSAGKIIGIVAIVVFFLVVIINMASGSPSSTTSTSQTTSTQTTPASTSPQTSFGDGTFIVGTDIEPGTYRTTGGSNCYYARLSGFGGTDNNIIANANTNGNGAIVTIKASDAGFQSSGCDTWTQIGVAPSSTSAAIAPPSKQSATTQVSTPVAPQPTPVPQAPATPKTWHTVTNFSGSAEQNTSPFTIQGSEWKVDWTANIPADGYCEQYGCDMYIGIKDTAGDVGDDILTPNLTANGSGNSYEYDGPGTFYFSIDPGDISLWTVTVEDYY